MSSRTGAQKHRHPMSNQITALSASSQHERLASHGDVWRRRQHFSQSPPLCRDDFVGGREGAFWDFSARGCDGLFSCDTLCYTCRCCSNFARCSSAYCSTHVGRAGKLKISKHPRPHSLVWHPEIYRTTLHAHTFTFNATQPSVQIYTHPLVLHPFTGVPAGVTILIISYINVSLCI